MSHTARFQQTLTALAALAMMFAMVGCDPSSPTGPSSSQSGSSQTTTPPKPRAQTPPPGAIELVFPYGSEKKHWLEDVTKQFNDQKHKLDSGKAIFVKPIAMGSGELTRETLEGVVKAHLISPASGAFITLGNAEAEVKFGRPLVGKTQNLVLSPVIIAMWKPMAEALGWPEKQLGWSTILEMAKNNDGWAKYGHPEWGRFKFGHTHPNYSNSGLISLMAETYAGAGKVRGLTVEDVAKPEVGQFLHGVEQAVVHYGRSTGFFGRKMFGNGPAYLSAAVLYENMVIESYNKQKHPNLPLDVVAIYPQEGTFWSDHPVGVVNMDWVTDEHREAAKVYIDYLLAKEQQDKAMDYGFRPADPLVPLRSPIDKAHGIDPDQPQTTLEVPSAQVMNAVKALWRERKKHANIVLVLDVSGSMQKEQRLANAKKGAEQLIEMLGDKDQLTVIAFNNHVSVSSQRRALGQSREETLKVINGFFPAGKTALYDAIAQAHKTMSANPTPDQISAVVVLSDGDDTASSTKLNQLLRVIGTDFEKLPVRVFTIGYGAEANKEILGKIADTTQAKFYRGKPENIREVFKEISTFF